MVLRVEQGVVPGVGLEPHVIVAVVLVRDVDHQAFGVLARVEHLEPVRAMDAGLRRAEPAPGYQQR